MQEVTENIFPIEWNLKDELKVPYHGKNVFGTFVCGGGSTMGYKLAGFNHLGGVEFTDHYSKVYKHNHKPKHFYLEDIREFNKRTDLPNELYELDLLDGSPPCAAFSTAGAREKNWGKIKDYEGIKQVKDDLVYVYCETIEKLKPKVFLLENVSGLAKGNAKVYLKRVVERMSKTYNVQVFLLYAASMGIPQIRNRIFVIGHKKEYKLPKLELNFNIPQLGFDVTKKYWDILDKNTFGFNFSIVSQYTKTKSSFTCCFPSYSFTFPQFFSLAPAVENAAQGGEPSKISNWYNSSGKSCLSLKVCIGSKKAYFGLWFALYASIIFGSISLQPITSKPASL